jgi:ubiquinone biosynthesis protein COQ4
MTRLFQLAHLARAFVVLTRDPGRLDAIFDFVEDSYDPEMVGPVVERMRTQPRGALALIQRPRVGEVDLNALGRLPQGTLGRVFAEHMVRRGLDPAALPVLEGESEDEYVLAHLYESHDVWHVVAGFDTDVKGELGLQAFNLAQFPGYVGLLILSAGLLNTLIFAKEQASDRMEEIARGWWLGRRVKSFLGVPWADWWDRPLVEVRADLGVPEPLAEDADEVPELLLMEA